MVLPTDSSYGSRDFASRDPLCSSGYDVKDCRPRRLQVLKGLAIVWGLIVCYRLYDLQIMERSRWESSAVKQHLSRYKIASNRGPITDRYGKLLAVSVPSGSIFVRPRKFDMTRLDEVSVKLAEILDLSPEYIKGKIQKKSPFVWIQRQIPKVVADKVSALEVKGLDFIEEPHRYYPYNEAGSALIGKVGIDGGGLSGIEASLDTILKGKSQSSEVIRDALGNQIQFEALQDFSVELPKGESVELTLDAEIQRIVNEELKKGREDTNSKAVVAVMLDALTGDILAMEQSPNMNFNTDSVRGRKDLLNYTLETVYEPGSTMKPLVMAAALEMKAVRIHDEIDCENGSFRFGRRTVNDVHGADILSVSDIIIRSSNIGMTKVGIRMGKERLYQALKGYGFGESSKLGLPGETVGIFRNVKGWKEIDIATHSYGQGIAVTPLQMVRAFSVIVNGGKLPKVRLYKNKYEVELEEVISPDIAAEVKSMLVSVVDDEHGTGRRAKINGVTIGGKTGTAQKARTDGRGYAEGLYVASFIGYADTRQMGMNIQPVLIVAVDEPHAKSIYGGTLAGPVFKRIMTRTINLLATRRELTE